MKVHEAKSAQAPGGLQKHIERLKYRILAVGGLVETAIARSISALVQRDAVLASAVIAADAYIDRAEVEVEEDCVRILEDHQPKGNDLRFVVAVLKINSSLERMGDLAENIASPLMQLHYLTRQLERLGDMATNVAENVIYMVEGQIVRHGADAK